MRTPNYNESDWQREQRYLEDAENSLEREMKKLDELVVGNGLEGREMCSCGSFAEEHVRGRFCERKGKGDGVQGILFEELG